MMLFSPFRDGLGWPRSSHFLDEILDGCKPSASPLCAAGRFQHPVPCIRQSVPRSAYDAGVRLRLLIVGSVIVLLAACGSGDGDGTRPSVSASLPSDASIVQPTSPPADAGTAPAETQPPEQRPEETAPPEEAAPPEATAPPQEQPEETAAPGTAPTSSVAPGDDGDGTVWWPWVLGALVVIGAIVAIARGVAGVRRGRSDRRRCSTRSTS